MKANKAGFQSTDLGFLQYPLFPEISEGIQQTLARLMGFDPNNLLYRQLITDSDGRLLVSTSQSTASQATNSAVPVGIASVILIGANPSRKTLYIQNLGTVPIYISYSGTALLSTGFQIPAAGTFIEDRYLGQINAISTVAAQDVRLVEV